MKTMSRRAFIRKTGILGASFLFINKLSGLSFLQPQRSERWLWMHPPLNLSDDEWLNQFIQIKQAGFKGIMVQVYASHKALYDNPYLPVEQDVLSQIIPLARETGLELHAWMWTMPNNNPLYAQEHPDWFVVNRAGKPAHTHPAYVSYYKFMCPNHPEVREFLRRNVAFLASISGLAGVHLDYIRMPDAILAEALQPRYNLVQDREYPEYDYCYCARCREGFKALTGKDPLIDLPDPTADSQWRQFRYDSVTSLVNEVLASAIHAGGKIATAAVFPNWESVRQQWTQWDLDAFFPMLYHNFYNADIQWIGWQINHFRSLLPSSKRLYAGLFVPSLLPDELMASELEALQHGADGVSMFDYAALTAEHWVKLSHLSEK